LLIQFSSCLASNEREKEGEKEKDVVNENGLLFASSD
jgi:hypothetical protein